jgi:peptidoglycan/LPS O-acetylase OafA/YrhL
MYSYSIYLWHGPTAAWLPGFFRRTLGFPVGHYGRFVVYFVGSLVIGIIMSKLVEYPILRLRDRILPASSIIPVAAQVGIGPALMTRSDAPLSDDVRGQQVLLDPQRVARVDPG